MGDKGGKKDKNKNQQQLATKQKQKEDKKQDKAPSSQPPPLKVRANHTVARAGGAFELRPL